MSHLPVVFRMCVAVYRASQHIEVSPKERRSSSNAVALFPSPLDPASGTYRGRQRSKEVVMCKRTPKSERRVMVMRWIYSLPLWILLLALTVVGSAAKKW